MANQLQTYVNPEVVNLDSGRIIVSENDNTSIDIGGADSIAIKRPLTTNETEIDNIDQIKTISKGDEAEVTFDWAEFDFARFSKLDEGTIRTPIAGTLQSGVIEKHYAPPLGESVILTNKNADNSAVTVNSITGSTTGALTVNTDYTVTTDSLGRTVINILASGSVTANEKLDINIDYTPSDEDAFDFVTSYIQTGKKVTIVSVNSKGKRSIFNFVNMKADPAIEYKLPSGHNTDKNTISMKLTGQFASSSEGHAILDSRTFGRF